MNTLIFQVNSIYSRVKPRRTNLSVNNDFKFVGQMFNFTGKQIMVGINETKQSTDYKKKVRNRTKK